MTSHFIQQTVSIWHKKKWRLRFIKNSIKISKTCTFFYLLSNGKYTKQHWTSKVRLSVISLGLINILFMNSCLCLCFLKVKLPLNKLFYLENKKVTEKSWFKFIKFRNYGEVDQNKIITNFTSTCLQKKKYYIIIAHEQLKYEFIFRPLLHRLLWGLSFINMFSCVAFFLNTFLHTKIFYKVKYKRQWVCCLHIFRVIQVKKIIIFFNSVFKFNIQTI